MKRFIQILQYIFFCVFFAIGAGAIALSILIDPELTTYYQNKQILEQTRRDNKTLESLTEQYQSQIDLVKTEPNVLARLESLTFGQAPSPDNETAIPRADSRELMQTARVILDEMQEKPAQTIIPKWMQRCSEEKFRKALFFSGAGLILVSFIFFGSPRQAPSKTARKNRFLSSGK